MRWFLNCLGKCYFHCFSRFLMCFVKKYTAFDKIFENPNAIKLLFWGFVFFRGVLLKQ